MHIGTILRDIPRKIPSIMSVVCSSLPSHQLAKQYSFLYIRQLQLSNCMDYDLHTRERNCDLGVTGWAQRISHLVNYYDCTSHET